jgi:hypothetical protein
MAKLGMTLIDRAFQYISTTIHTEVTFLPTLLIDVSFLESSHHIQQHNRLEGSLNAIYTRLQIRQKFLLLLDAQSVYQDTRTWR